MTGLRAVVDADHHRGRHRSFYRITPNRARGDYFVVCAAITISYGVLPMELRHLRYFVIVAEESNFRRAAERLHVSQPALSKQIKDLEHELGLNLLSRYSTGVRLTAAGHVYFEEARNVLAHVQRAGAMARDAAEGRRGQLSIGNVGPISSSFMPSSLALFREKFPEVEVTLVEMGPFEQVAALESGAIHVGFTGGDNTALPAHFEHFHVLESPICVVMNREHKLAKTPRVSLAELSHERLLCFSGENQASRHSEYLRAAFTSRGLKPGPIRLVDGLESLLALIAGGQGVSLVPRVVSITRAEGVIAKPVKETGDDLIFHLSAVWLASETSQAARNFVDILRSTRPQGCSKTETLSVSK